LSASRRSKTASIKDNNKELIEMFRACTTKKNKHDNNQVKIDRLIVDGASRVMDRET